MAISRDLRRDILLGLVLTVGFGATALFCIALTRQSGGVAALWLPSGLLAAGFVLLPLRRAIVLGAACTLTGAMVNLLVGAPMSALPIYAGLNLMEATVAALLVRRICGPRRRISNLATLLKIALLAILPASILATLIAGATLGYLSLSTQEIMIGWFTANALGMAITLPAVLLLADQRDGQGPFRSNIEQFSIYGLVAVVSALAYLPHTVPTPMLLTPALVAAAFRLGPRGVALAALMMAIIATTVLALGPPDRSGFSQPQLILNLQFVIATALFTSLSVALILSEQARTRRLLDMRTRAAKRAQAQAQAAGRAKGEFLATMSHEIRTPMNSILGFTQTLRRREDLPDEARRQLELIHRAGGSLLAVVNDILDYSRLETGEVELALQPQTGRGVAEDALGILAPAAMAKGLDMQLEQTGPTDAPVMIDDLRVRQILLNLLSNAVKFTSAGEVRLKLTARDQGSDVLLRFEVHDTGVGIPRNHMPRLFRRFSQADSSVSRAYGGSGLGLAICKGLVEAMGGLIGVKSQPGVGSVFWFEIIAEHATAPQVDAVVEAEPVSADALGRVRVLLVDDHPMNRDLGATVLAILGCEVELACDGAEALNIASKGGLDAILMDIHMPVMDGLEATRMIRALEGPAGQVPIIAMSADVLPEMTERCRRAGMSDAVGKPIQIEDLQSALTRWTQDAPRTDNTRDINAVA